MEYSLDLHESLKIKSSVWNFDKEFDAEILEKSMINFMLENKGIGLAANQIGIIKRMFVMGGYSIDGFPEPTGIFNPKILEFSDHHVEESEGCLSYPKLWLKIKRPEAIVAEFQNSGGEIIKKQFAGLASRCFQHELDHLDGICFVDKVSKLKLQLAMKKQRKQKNDRTKSICPEYL